MIESPIMKSNISSIHKVLRNFVEKWENLQFLRNYLTIFNYN